MTADAPISMMGEPAGYASMLQRKICLIRAVYTPARFSRKTVKNTLNSIIVYSKTKNPVHLNEYLYTSMLIWSSGGTNEVTIQISKSV